jgi:molecular chaperone GrpE
MMMRKKRKNEEERQSQMEQGQNTAEQLKQEPTIQLPGAEELQKQVDELRRRVEDLKKERDDIFSKLQHVAADFDNYQKRSSRQITDSIAYEKDKLIKALLPVLDNFEHALANSNFNADAEAMLKGVRIVYDHLLDVLRGQGVEQIKAVGERFDPTHHEAITQRSDASKEEGLVLEELQRGYKLNGRVIRASRVVVNKATAAESEQQAEEEETRDTQ